MRGDELTDLEGSQNTGYGKYKVPKQVKVDVRGLK